MSVSVKFTGDAADLLAKQKQVADGAAKITGQYKATSEELTRLRRVAKQVWDETSSAQEKYAKRMADLNRLLKEGKINQDQFAKSAENAKQKMDAAGESATIPQRAFASLAQFTSGLNVLAVGAAAAAAAIAKAFVDAHEEMKQAGDMLSSAKFGMGELTQVARNASDLQSLKSRAEAARAAGATQDLDEAYRLSFAVRSAGLDSDFDTFSQLGAAKVVGDMPTTVRAVSMLQQSMGAAETGNTQSILSKAFAASQVSPDAADRILAATARAGTGASALGFSDEEILAAVSSGSAKVGSDQASTRLNALLRVIEKNNLSSGTLLGTVDSISNKLQAGANIRSIFGDNAEAIEGFRLIAQDRAGVGANLANIQSAATGSELASKLGMAQADADIAANIARDTGAGSQDVAAKQRGRMQNTFQGLQSARDAYNESMEGWSGVRRSLWRQWSSVDWAGHRYVGDGDLASAEDFRWLESERQQNRGNPQALAKLDKIANMMEQMVKLQQGGTEETRRTRRSTPSIPKPEN